MSGWEKVAIIPTKDLRSAQVPSSDATWLDIKRFAASFDVREMNPYNIELGEIGDASIDDGLTFLRAHLFGIYRRFNHYGRNPNDIEMSQILTVLGAVRELVAATP